MQRSSAPPRWTGALVLLSCGAALLLSAPARATTGSTGDETGGETTGGETTGGETTGGETTGGETLSGGDDSGMCGSCSAPPASIQILSPADGASVASPFTVTVDATYSCSCDTCGCYEDQPWGVDLVADGSSVGGCSQNCTGTHTIEVELPPGPHELRAISQYSFHSESSETITITVTATPGGSAGTTSEPGDTDSGESGSLADRNDGCACSASDPGDETRLGLLGLLTLLGFRGRSRRRRR